MYTPTSELKKLSNHILLVKIATESSNRAQLCGELMRRLVAGSIIVDPSMPATRSIVRPNASAVQPDERREIWYSDWSFDGCRLNAKSTKIFWGNNLTTPWQKMSDRVQARMRAVRDQYLVWRRSQKE